MFKRISGLMMLMLVAAPLFGTAAQAQTQPLQVGYTDHELIIVNMPDYRRIQEQLQQEYVTAQEGLQQQSQAFQQQVERYQTQQSLLSEQSRTEREQELMQRQQELQQAAMQQEQQLQQRESELMQPLFERVQTAIDAVAEQRGLDLVIRSQVGMQPVILYVNEDRLVDITLDVARRLGIEVDEEPAAASNSN